MVRAKGVRLHIFYPFKRICKIKWNKIKAIGKLTSMHLKFSGDIVTIWIKAFKWLIDLDIDIVKVNYISLYINTYA